MNRRLDRIGLITAGVIVACMVVLLAAQLVRAVVSW